MPKVIDFGIAKATACRLTDKTVLTEVHQMIGTPQYMSPEQAAARASTSTAQRTFTRSACSCTSCSPRTPSTIAGCARATLLELQRMIREEEPPPSVAAQPVEVDRGQRRGAEAIESTSGASATSRTAARPNRTKLVRYCADDLDWIVMKCLEKDRHASIATANALAETSAAFLDDQRPGDAGRRRATGSRSSSCATVRRFVAGAAGRSGAVGGGGECRSDSASKRSAAAREGGRRQARGNRRADRKDARGRAREGAIPTGTAEYRVDCLAPRLRTSLLAQARETAPQDLTPADLRRAHSRNSESLTAESNFTGIALDALDEHYFQPAREAIEDAVRRPAAGSRRNCSRPWPRPCRRSVCSMRTQAPQEAGLEIRRPELGDENRDTIASIHSWRSWCNDPRRSRGGRALLPRSSPRLPPASPATRIRRILEVLGASASC